MRLAILPCFAALFLLLLLPPVVAGAAPPVVLFDQAHAEQFLAQGEDGLGLSQLAALFTAQGFEVRTTQQPLAAQSLDEVAAVVISGPFTPLTKEEITSLDAFVQRGGRLAVMLHIAAPLSELLGRFGVIHSNGVIRETGTSVLANEALNFRVAHLEADPLLAGLPHFAVYGSWALATEDERAGLLATSSERAWVDLNGNHQLDQGDAVQPFGIVALVKHGGGEVLVFGDDALFQNRYLIGSNLKLGENLAKRFKP